MNLDRMTSLAGQTIAISDLVQLNKALQAAGAGLAKASNVGYPQQGVNFGSTTGSELAPLVPQSIQPTLDVATYSQEAIVLWRHMHKQMVGSTLHEAARVNNFGTMHLDPFISEGGAGNLSEGDYERKVVKIKYLAEKREISDVATMVSQVGYTGVSKAGLQQQTQDGTMALLGKLERSLFSADENLSDLHFDGVIKQISGGNYSGTGDAAGTRWEKEYTNSGSVTDLRGKEVSPQDLVEAMYKTYSAPNFGLVDKILVEPRTYGRLVNIATTYGRFPMESSGPGQLVFGAKGLMIAGPMGLVPVIPTPLLQNPETANSTAIGDSAPSTPVLKNALASPAHATSKFTADDAGSYTYQIVAVGEGGASAPLTTAAIAVAAGDAVTIDIDSAGKPSGNAANAVSYYRVYRKGPNDAEHIFLGEFPRCADSTKDTGFFETNIRIPGTAPVVLLQNTPDVLYWAQLLDFLRRPLAQVATTVPFLLMLFGAPFVKVPTKNHIIQNAAR